MSLVLCAFAMAVLSGAAAGQADGAITSENHPKLKAMLAESPKADADGDGVLTYKEYETFFRSRQAEKVPAGHQRGLLSMVLPTGALLIADFDEDDTSKLTPFGWKTQGQAFARPSGEIARLIRRRVGGVNGKNLLSSMGETDAQVGSVLSPPFQLELPYVEFSLSGGDNPGRLSVNLLVEGKVVRSATGKNDDRFDIVAFDVASLKGSAAQLQVIDGDSGVWGHINVDRVVQTEKTQAKRIVAEPPETPVLTRATVLTSGDRLEGSCEFAGKSLVIDGKPVTLDSLLQVVFSGQPEPGAQSPHSVKLTNGELWSVRIVGFENGKVAVESDLLGNRQIPVARTLSLMFQPGAGRGDKPGTLYRTTGDPIKGELVWIREKDIAIDCALGVVPIPRSTILRYVVKEQGRTVPRPDQPNHAEESALPLRDPDEIGLVDGSLLRGRLSEGDQGLSLSHEEAGAVSPPWSAVRYIRRTPAHVRWLESLRISQVSLSGPVAPPPTPQTVNAEHGTALKSMRILPHTTVQFELEGLPRTNSDLMFRARLAPVPGARARTNVRIVAGGKNVWESNIAAGGESVAVAVALSAAERFSIEVDYAGPVAFPAGVDWLDAHVIASSSKSN